MPWGRQGSVARAQLSLAPTQLCPKQRVSQLGAELSCRNDGSDSGTAAHHQKKEHYFNVILIVKDPK